MPDEGCNARRCQVTLIIPALPFRENGEMIVALLSRTGRTTKWCIGGSPSLGDAENGGFLAHRHRENNKMVNLSLSQLGRR